MSNFENLADLLSHLEEHAAECGPAYRISPIFEEVHKRKEMGGEKEEAEKALWENRVFGLMFMDGDIPDAYSHITQTLDSRTYAYITQRLKDTQNAVMRARYAHTLWCTRRGIKYARVAIDSYLLAAREYEHWDRTAPEEKWGLEIAAAIQNAYTLAARTEYRTNDAKAELLRLIKSFNMRSSWSFGLRRDLIRVTLKDKKHFGEKELAGLQDVCWRLASTGMRSNNEPQVHDAIVMIDLGQQIDKRIKQESHNWDLATATCNEKLMHMQEERGDSTAASCSCLRAIENYRTADKQEKAKRLERQFLRLASSAQLDCVTFRVDMTDVMKHAHQLADGLVRRRPEEVIRWLVHQTELLPRRVDIKRMLSNGVVDPLLMDAASSTIDNRGHLTEHSATTEEREKRVSLQLFAQHLELHCLVVIDEVILRAVGQQKLSVAALRGHFQESSWLAKDRMAQSPTRGTYRYRWWDLLEPSLVGYFEKTRQWLLDRTRVPNLILEIDSLTPKFEGLLRDLLQLAGAPTFQPKRQDRSLTEEMYIGKLLRMDDVMKRLFAEDDLLFLRFLFSEDSGYDLRNKVAHCLMLAEDYGIQYMHLLLLALLKLSKYDFAEPSEFIRTRHGVTFHRATCRMVTRIAPKDRVALSVHDAAQRKKYRPCGLCNPDHTEETRKARIDGRETQPVLVIRF